ncbi:MAG: AsmA family protein [Alphaproteobacteria bacterium]
MTARRRAWLVVGLVLGVVAAAGVAGVVWALGRVVPYAEGMASDGVGRSVTIGGISLDGLSWSPVVRLNDVRVADAEWRDDEPMLVVEAIAAQIDLEALLRFEVVLRELRIERPRVRLGVDRDGRTNWQIGKDEDGAEPGEGGPDDRRLVPRIERITITDGTLEYVDAVRAVDIKGTVATATGQTEGAIGMRARGTLEGAPMTVTFDGGPISVLHDTDEPYPLRLKVVAGTGRLEFDGNAADLFALDGLDGRLDVAGDDLAEMAALVGLAAPDTPPFELRTRLTRRGDRWRLADLTGDIGDSDVAGTLAIDAGGPKPMISGDLLSRRLDLYELGPLVGLPAQGAAPPAPPGGGARAEAGRSRAGAPPEADALPAEAGGDTGPRPGRRVLPDAPLDTERLDRVDAHITFRSDNVLAPGLPLRDVSLTLDLKGRRLALSPLRFGLRGGTVSANLVIHGGNDPVRSEVEAAFSQLDLAELVGGGEGNPPITGQLFGRTRLTLLGNTVHRGMANATGRLAMAMTGGEIDAVAVEAAGLDVGQALLTLADDGERFPVRCLAMSFRAESGIFTSEAFVLDTSDSQLVASGSVDMRDEALHLEMLAHPKDASIGSARTPIEVGGTLAEPRVSPGAGGLAGRGAAAVALGVVLGPLAAFLPFIEPGLAEDADCAGLIGSTGLPTASPTAPGR